MSVASEEALDAITRLEQLPLTRFHMKLRFVIGVATFFDLFDAIMIAFVVPALIAPWRLTPPQIGVLISAAYVGQFVGALGFGWLAGKIGRRRTILITTVFYGVGSLMVAASWNYPSMLLLRVLQGIGLGGEVPVASAYLSEWVAASRRGRYVAFFELSAPLGILVAGLLGAWVVPQFGWRWMFIIGALPALLVFPLRRQIPESPRFLLKMKRYDEAERIIASLEREAANSKAAGAPAMERGEKAPLPNFIKRAWIVGLVWFACYFINYGLTGWLPAIYRSVFHLDVATSLRYGLATSVAGVIGAILCGLLIDRIGRRAWFVLAFVAAAVPLLALAWMGSVEALTVVALCSAAYVFVSGCSAALYLYTPEIFPTGTRALGVGVGSACARVASAVAPVLVGLLLSQATASAVFVMFGAVALFGALISISLYETAGRGLEVIVGERLVRVE
jgi:MFS transporter, putative metabolite:H+ symporter